ncbi:MAG: CDP-alcohol phosphatidyltransferase family protein [Oscillospiraceae bacterium]|nr:CDP-alcohol phosphatidyltransferase family protein [Oscillospiraceae bacterium]MDY5735742.1 CDP-alcohol phosphatidyltransferase family protein [Oscillospiraceae bacterium]MDY6020004.1 CDP-alcohol phosphatidyltransferase family protein [Oscillospiraceae bacterium]
MIGVYDYTVIATYLSLLFGLAGIYSASRGNLFAAILFLMLAGLLDAFDGRIARTKKNRTDTEKRFGIQIDSLNDLVCFGVLPAAIGTAMGCTAIWFLTTMAFFTLCALIRLAYFNVMEEERQEGTSEVRKFYLGVPVTSASFIIPAYYLLSLYGGLTDYIVYAIGLFVLGVAFIAPVRVTKPGLKGILFMGLLGIAELVLFLLSVPGK